MQENFTAFRGQRRLASGPVAEVALAVKRAQAQPGEPILIFDDASGRAVDFDLRGEEDEVLARLARPDTAQEPGAPRGRGRPKLGVMAREVTLLPRHWEWLNAQAGGASVALRKLVEEARRAHGERDRARQARDAAHHFMSAMAGNLVHFEEAARALFSEDRRRFEGLIADWPADIREHAASLAYGERAKVL
ncbi:DUF2239 family protein [Bradyrhizobium sp.]|uniref:DUF2239 family protein n=1 Tax=Bradyrhizobium sp. TaxID=376 RepID=UPI00239D6A7C|nr:DUF2239 family protein [Bradyrhizobium sp.]MDE2375708.1 DUF2239 family protein [Bradyrhizobium sp.]